MVVRENKGEGTIMAKPALDLKEIIGRVSRNAEWLKFPSTIESRSPFDQNAKVFWRIDPTTVIDAFKDSNRKQPLLDLWSIVLGITPPISGASSQLEKEKNVKLTSLGDAHACFRGVNRPVGDDLTGANSLAYIVKARHCFSFNDESFCPLKLLRLPPDVVLIVYVSMDQAYDKARASLKGVITHWSLVETQPNDAMLPIDFDKRFASRIW